MITISIAGFERALKGTTPTDPGKCSAGWAFLRNLGARKTAETSGGARRGRRATATDQPLAAGIYLRIAGPGGGPTAG